MVTVGVSDGDEFISVAILLNDSIDCHNGWAAGTTILPLNLTYKYYFYYYVTILQYY